MVSYPSTLAPYSACSISFVLRCSRQRGTPTSRSFFAGAEVTRNHADVGWTRESAGSTPRALDRDFVAAEAGNSNAAVGGGVVGTANARTSTAATPRGKMYNRRTWTKEENEHLQAGIASLGGDDGEIGKNVRACSGSCRCLRCEVPISVLGEAYAPNEKLTEPEAEMHVVGD